jgi:hypothetical protein
MAPTSPAAQRVEEAKAISKKDASKAESIYREVLSKGPGSTEASSRDYEAALIGLGELYRDVKKPQELSELIKTSRDAFSSFAKAKTAKLGELLPLQEWALDGFWKTDSVCFSSSAARHLQRDPEYP